MRIGLFTDTYPPYINGVSTSVCMLKHALEKKGHQVFVVTVNNDSLKYNCEENDTVIRIPGIPIGIYDYRLTGVYPLRATNIIKKWNLDIIHSHTEFGVGTFARIIAKQLDIPLVHTYHTMYEDYVHYIKKGYFDGASKKIVEYLTKFYCDKTIEELIDKCSVLEDFKAVQEGNVWCTTNDMYQQSMSIGDLIEDIHNMLLGEDEEEMEYLFRLE